MSASAVDEGRNPYGLPGRGNGRELWDRAKQIPCPTCGARTRTVEIVKNRAVITCKKVDD